MEDGSTKIPAYLFRYSSLQRIIIPETVTTIGVQAFQHSKKLDNVVLPESVTSIDKEAFDDCSGLTDLTLPAGLLTIGSNAFSSCTGLNSIDLPDSITSMGEYAFADCTGISGTLILPANLSSMGNQVFLRCTSITKVKINKKLSSVGSYGGPFQECAALVEAEMEDGSTGIPDYLFKYCTSLRGIGVPDSVTSIGKDSFLNVPDTCVFYVVTGSYAYNWALEHGYPVSDASLITYVLNGGTNNPDNITAYENGDTFRFFDPSRQGYRFDGWYEDSALTTKIETTSGKTGNLTVYAKWIPFTYSLKFEANFPADATAKATSTAVADMTGISSSQTITIPTCTYECMKYGFTTWNTKADGTGDSYKAGAKISAISEEDGATVTLYAQWISAPVSRITLSETKIEIQVDGSAEITAAIEPDDAINKILSWSSLDTSIATVTVDPADNTKAVIKGLASGTTQILAAATDGSGCEAICKIVVGKGSVGSTALDTQPAFTSDSIILVKGQKFTLDGEWESSNTSLLAMNKKGAGTAKNKTSAPIELKQKENGALVKTYNVTIVQPGLQKSATLIAGETTQLTVTSAGGLNVTWSSSAPDVASVSTEGVVSGISKGSATVTAYINGVAFNCKVTVKDADTSKRDLTKNVAVKLVPMQTITAKASGFNAKKATWSSDRTPKTEGLAKGVVYEDDIVRITKAGKITAIGVGTTALKATGGGKELNFTIEVQEPSTQIVHLNKGANKTIKLYGTKGNLSWAATDTSVVKITGNKIQGLKYGETILTTKYENIDYTVEVYVEDPVITAEGITGKYPTYTLALKKGQTVILGIDQVYQDVIFQSNKNNIAFISEDGVISARSKGKAVMTTKINGKKITLNVNVSDQ